MILSERFALSVLSHLHRVSHWLPLLFSVLLRRVTSSVSFDIFICSLHCGRAYGNCTVRSPSVSKLLSAGSLLCRHLCFLPSYVVGHFGLHSHCILPPLVLPPGCPHSLRPSLLGPLPCVGSECWSTPRAQVQVSLSSLPARFPQVTSSVPGALNTIFTIMTSTFMSPALTP